jgi:hypothetical protein
MWLVLNALPVVTALTARLSTVPFTKAKKRKPKKRWKVIKPQMPDPKKVRL